MPKKFTSCNKSNKSQYGDTLRLLNLYILPLLSGIRKEGQNMAKAIYHGLSRTSVTSWLCCGAGVTLHVLPLAPCGGSSRPRCASYLTKLTKRRSDQCGEDEGGHRLLWGSCALSLRPSAPLLLQLTFMSALCLLWSSFLPHDACTGQYLPTHKNTIHST